MWTAVRFNYFLDLKGLERDSGRVEFLIVKAKALVITGCDIILKTFQNMNRKKLMRVCFQGARLNDIADNIDREIGHKCPFKCDNILEYK